MKIADRELSVDAALAKVQGYAASYPRTLEIFDGLGDSGYVDPSPDAVTLADIGRLVIINARPSAGDVPVLLDVKATDKFQKVPRDATLEDCVPGGQLWHDASDLYSLFRLHNIAKAKRSKLLHAKRPGLVVISDSVTEARYRAPAKKIASSAEYETKGYWEAVRADIMQDEFRELMDRVALERVPGLNGNPTLAPLTAVRVLDIVCWTP